MNLLAAGAIACLGLLGLLITRSVLFPGVVFAAVWAAALLLLEASGDVFYPIGDAARAIYLLGAAAFVAGALCGRAFAPGLGSRGPRRTLDPAVIGLILDAFLIVLVLAIPFYWAELQRIAREVAVESVLRAARIRSLEGADAAGRGIPVVIANLVQMSIAATYVALAVDGRGRRWWVRRIALLVLALAYQILTGSRSGAAALVIGAIGVSWVRTGRVQLRVALPAVAILLVGFAVVAIQLEKGFVRRDLGLRANVPALLTDLQWYALAGVTGFDHVARDPTDVPSTGGVTRGVRELASRFGADTEVPDLHAQYRTVGDARSVNVYSVYFNYLPATGLAGTAALLWGAGVLCALVFVLARAGSPAGRVLYGIAFAGICQSVFNEAFYNNVNFVTKTLLLLGILYAVAGRPRVPPPPATPA